MKKYKILLPFFLGILLLITARTGFSQTVTCPEEPTNPIRLTSGLLSASDGFSATSRFNTPEACVLGERATIPSFSIPTYAEMKSIYFDKNKTSNKINISGDITVDNQGKINENNIPANQEHLINISGNLSLGNAIDVKQGTIIVVFVNGNLNINTNQTYNNPNSKGLVFVVSGNINVAPAVTEINAFMTTYGTFCSASGAESACLPEENSRLLTINGSVISLNPNQPPKFVRSLANNTNPAEIVNYQPKYLVILKNIFSRTLTIWKEIQ